MRKEMKQKENGEKETLCAQERKRIELKFGKVKMRQLVNLKFISTFHLLL